MNNLSAARVIGVQLFGPVLWRMVTAPAAFVYRNVHAFARGVKERAYSERVSFIIARTMYSIRSTPHSRVEIAGEGRSVRKKSGVQIEDDMDWRL